MSNNVRRKIICSHASALLCIKGWTKQKCLQSTKTFLDQTYLIKSRSTSFCAAASVYQLYEHYTHETGFFEIIKFKIRKNNIYPHVIIRIDSNVLKLVVNITINKKAREIAFHYH